MLIAQLRKRVIIRSTISAVLVVSCAIGYYIIDSYKISLDERLQLLQSTVASEQGKLTKLAQQKKDFAESIKLWKQLSDQTKKQEGLKIDEGRKALESLKERYHLTDLTIEFTPPEELTDKYKTDSTVVMSSAVTLTFKSLTDEYALSFLKSLSHELPGYMKVTSLKLTRSGQVDDATIRSIATGQYPPLVTGSAIIQWRDLKSTSGATSIPAPKNTKKLQEQ